MTRKTESSQIVTPHRAQQLIILALGLCLAGLWTWRAGLIRHPTPAQTQPQQKYFIEITGDLPRPGVQVFGSAPTLQDVWESAGGRETIQNASQPLSSGNMIILAPDRSFSLSRMSGRDLLTLGLAIDPNLATAEDLEAIPGIGPVLAKRIVEFREEHGPFQNIENLLDVKGMGPKILDKIKPYVVIIAEGQVSQ